MNDSIVCGIEEQNKFKLDQLIRIRCLVRDCDFEKADIIPIPSIINIDQIGDERITQYLCKKHQNMNYNAINNDNNLNKQITFCQQLVRKPLKFVEKIQPYEMILRQAELKLDKNSCCLRENMKYFNVKQVKNTLELISNDDTLIHRLIKSVMIQKYMELVEIKNEINSELNSNKINTLKYFTLIYRYNQIVNQITSDIKSYIKESEIILQPQRRINDIYQQKFIQQIND